MTSRRMERTLEMTSDMEFRLLRMEKRLQTLMISAVTSLPVLLFRMTRSRPGMAVRWR